MGEVEAHQWEVKWIEVYLGDPHTAEGGVDQAQGDIRLDNYILAAQIVAIIMACRRRADLHGDLDDLLQSIRLVFVQRDPKDQFHRHVRLEFNHYLGHQIVSAQPCI